MRDEERFVREVRTAEGRVRVGGIYRHYKKGGLYENFLEEVDGGKRFELVKEEER